MPATRINGATVDFVDARPLLESRLNVDELPAPPAELGAMTQVRWYCLEIGKLDPHREPAWDFPMLLKASVVK